MADYLQLSAYFLYIFLEKSATIFFLRKVKKLCHSGAVFMSHKYAMSVRSPMSDIAMMNHSDCKNWHAWVTHMISHSYVGSWQPRNWSHAFLGMMHHIAHVLRDWPIKNEALDRIPQS